jgi:hypothetical protein
MPQKTYLALHEVEGAGHNVEPFFDVLESLEKLD